MFSRLRAFHQRTMERYLKQNEEEMEEWKKRVMRIHREAAFLFYVEEMEGTSAPLAFIIRGETVKGKRETGEGLALMDGEGNTLALAVVTSPPEEKEGAGKGVIQRRLNEFTLSLTRIGGEDADSMEAALLRRHVRNLSLKISLITEARE